MFIAVVLIAIDSPLPQSLVVSLLIFLSSTAVCTLRGNEFVTWTSAYLDSLMLLGITAFTYVLLVSSDSTPMRIVTLCIGVGLSASVVFGPHTSAKDDSKQIGLALRKSNYEFLVPVFAMNLLSLRGMFPLLPSALAVVFGVFVYQRRKPVCTRLLAAVLVCVAALASRLWFRKEPYYFIVSYDQQFRSSLATGLTRWGYSDLNSAAGTSVNYHWLSEGVSGFLSRVGVADEFVVVTQVIPALGFIAAVIAIWRFCRFVGLEEFAALLGAVISALVLLEMDPYSIGTLFGAAIALRALESATQVTWNFQSILYLLTLSVLLLMAQTPYGLTVSLTLSGVTIVRAIMSRRLELLLAGPLFVIVTLLLRYTLLSPNSGTPGSLSISNILQHGGLHVAFGLDKESPRILTALNSLGFVMELCILGLPIFSHLVRRKYRASDDSAGLVLIAVLGGVSLVLLNLVDLGFAQHKLMSVFLLCCVPLSVAIVWTEASSRSLSCTICFSLPIGLLLALFYFTIRHTRPDSVAAVASISFLLASTLGVVAVLAYSSRCRKIDSRISANKRAVVFQLPLILVLGVVLGRPDRNFISLNREPLDVTIMTGSPELRECLDWIRFETSESVIIATDLHDPIGLPGSGRSHLVSLVTKRRVYLDGPFTKRFDTDLVKERQLRDDNIATVLSMVEYLVISSELLDSSELLQLLPRKIGNDSCVVLQVP